MDVLPEKSCRVFENAEEADLLEPGYLHDLLVHFLPSLVRGAFLAPEDGWIPAALAPIRQGSSHFVGGVVIWPLDCKLILNRPLGGIEPEIVGVAVRYVRQLEGEANDPTEKALTPGQGS